MENVSGCIYMNLYINATKWQKTPVHYTKLKRQTVVQNWKTQKYTTTQEACGSAASLTLDLTRWDFFSHG